MTVYSRNDVLPFVAQVQVFSEGRWIPEAQGSTRTWLREQRDELAQVYRCVRVVTYWGEEIQV